MRGTRLVGVCIAALLWLALPCAAQSTQAAQPSKLILEDIGFLTAESFDVGDGLPARSVVAAAVAPQGQVWLGTMRGLVRYNTRRFVPEPGPANALAGAIGDIAATPDGRVWVSVPGGSVYVREKGLWREVGANASLPAEGGLRLRSFNRGADYRLFATGRGTLSEWNGTRWQAHAMPTALRDTELFDVLLQSTSNPEEDLIWIASFGKGLWRCAQRGPCEPVPMTEPGPRFNEITSLEHWTDPSDGSPVLWVASYGGGLARRQHGQWQRTLAADNGLPSNFLQRLLAQNVPGEAPHLWVGTRTGLAHRVGDNWVPLDAAARFTGATVKALAASRTARGAAQLWIGSDLGAARQPLVGAWRTISQVGRRGNGVWAVLHETIAGDEQFWLGSDGEGLLHRSKAGWRHFREADGLPSDMVRSVARDPDSGELLLGTWGGQLSRFDGKRFRPVPTPWPKSDHEAVTAIRVDHDGSLWFALRESGLAHRQAGRWTLYGPPDGHASRVYDLQRVGDVLWASTNTRGLARINSSGELKYFSRDEGLPDNSYYGLTLVPDAQGRRVLWAGSLRSGVVRLDVTDPDLPGLVTTPALPVPPDPFVYEVLSDGRGNQFVSTNYGASLWTPRRDGGFEATDFHRPDGLPHDEANYGALQLDGAGRIWMGTLGGLGVFSVTQASAASAASRIPLVIEQFSIDGKTVAAETLARPIELSTGPHDLHFEMALHTGEREAATLYRSQLLGLEPEPTQWSRENQRTFTALPPGDYRLRLEARDATGAAARPFEIALGIPLPFWRTPPAMAVLALGSALLLYLLLRLRESQQRQRETLLVDLVRQRTSELETRGLELRRINEELTRLSYHDPLTDLANRRMLLERLHGEWDLAQARGLPLAFLLFDLDQFKAYNDQRGHLAGDDCLREIGRRIDAELPSPGDTAGRYGGEEFGVVLPGRTLEEGARVAERIRQVVEQAAMAHPGSPQGVVTISVGVASVVPRAGFSAELLIAAADAALYRAKAGGKNRVEVADSDRG